MRLWHQKLIPYLPRQQLLGQHRECCALRGAGWSRKHSTVDYVFTHDPAYLIAYHFLIIDEMINRGYNPDITWRHPDYRGKNIGYQKDWANFNCIYKLYESEDIIYPEHNNDYLKECLYNLKRKGINIICT